MTPTDPLKLFGLSALVSKHRPEKRFYNEICFSRAFYSTFPILWVTGPEEEDHMIPL